MDTVANPSKAQTIKENVMLFEDILEDLQAGYVDPVNPTKLFETAVSAMLKVRMTPSFSTVGVIYLYEKKYKR